MDFSARDILWHVLYDTDIDFMKQVCIPSSRRMAAYGKADGIDVMLRESGALTVVRVIFFILLNIDEELRSTVCSASECRTIMSTKHGRVSQLCPYKADRFFKDLNAKCVPSWMRNETKSITEFLEELRMLYLVS
jgi:hypothetical protein